jgi:hypothetical protein
MKRIVACVFILGLCCGSAANAQGLEGFSFPGLGLQCGNLTVKPYAQLGFQHMGANINLPVAAEFVSESLDLQIDTLDLSLRDANFWTGVIGFSVAASEKYSLFASAGGDLGHSFITNGIVPVNVNGMSTSANLDFTNSKLGTWFIQTGVSVGPILAGLYLDKFTIDVGDPRTAAGPTTNQTLRGDLVTTTLCPYLGFALPVSSALLTVIYSPFAMANTTLALRSSNSGETQLQYKWNKPGGFLSGSFQYNQEISKTLSFGLWSSYLWMDQRGTAGLAFDHKGTNPVTRDKEVIATMTKYIMQGGLALTVTF